MRDNNKEMLLSQQVDEESGLHYNHHRYYDPQQGRYIMQDPIGLRGYNYPLNLITMADPLGLKYKVEAMAKGRGRR